MFSEIAISDGPKVSILLPNLNNRQFLKERFQTILNQTLRDWELIVVDGYSDDGAWELIQDFAASDGRVRISQAPREGVYAGINRCVLQARGEYIYIATSDDTMTPDCLRKMTSVLETHSECDLCHCCLHIIDESGDPSTIRWEDFPPQQFYGNLIYKPHIRKAPLDGLLHFGLYTVYHSLTQLLIRRTVFSKIGLFRSDWGSYGDFEWDMRASLTCNTFHLPEYLATWRVHRKQATGNTNTPEHCRRLLEMALEAVTILQQHDPEFYRKLNIKRLKRIYEKEELFRAFQKNQADGREIEVYRKYALQYPRLLLKWWLLSRLSCNPLHRKVCFLDNIGEITGKVAELGILDNVQIVHQ